MPQSIIKQSKPSVAVTGAGGLVGSYLCEYLAKKEYRVTALVRSANRPAHLIDCANRYADFVKIAVADVTNPASLKSTFSGVDVVVHAAGNVNPYGSRQAIFATNVDGTRNALRAAIEEQVKQFIHVSSLSVITGQGDQYDVNEEAEPKYCGENYADSKVESEKLVLAQRNADAIKVTAIRPGFIYGPHERTWMPRLIESIKLGKAALIDGGTKETNVVYVENLCRAIEGAILNPLAYGEIYNITDGQKVTKKDLFDAISDGLQMPRVNKRIPGFLAKPFCELVSTIAPFLPATSQQKLARYSRAAFRLAGLNQGFSIAKAERQLNYTSRVLFAQGMAETLAHFRTETISSSAASNKERSSTVGGSVGR